MKNLYSGRLYWPETLSQYQTYLPLESDLTIQVAIIGGGLSGALCGYELAKQGIPSIILERGEIAGGSTAANTGLLQFSNDIMLSELIDQIGESAAVLFYRACELAIRQLRDMSAELGKDVEFAARSSLYFASHMQDVPKLKREYETLHSHGFQVEYWEPSDISARFPFRKPGAIVTHGDAEVNPFRFVHAAAEAAARKGAAIHEGTDIIAHETLADGRHRLRTSHGASVDAEHVIYAVGYEPEKLRGKLIKADLNRSFAIATEKQPHLDSWYGRYLIWETARPYSYMRTTTDGRILAGGLDEDTPIPLESDRLQHERTSRLHEQIKQLFPSCQAPLAYEWNATFGESRDNLPFIGKDPAWPGVYYCLGYGGNGTVYSMIASQLVTDQIRGIDHPLADIVRLDRPTLQEA
ncbi:NAD(P)/FAD-dependent oxidoreductase [Paenibacillus mendelii]|uniref:NAD(P)/FAD-dependent oxidoreductase n=1 Tax=Paenibacillus mendelii TaxID=206163 RepID=A0ABV6JJ17_9BACL|nr:FAD-binding oxidoreductase [Paenibacillus mendelii]MCQ6558841.1 FAD-binding oxidoreductase [Paenibacillus mendelii]